MCVCVCVVRVSVYMGERGMENRTVLDTCEVTFV
jgi:hypothetical protein